MIYIPMSNLMIKYVAQREIYSFGKKHDWKNLHFKGPCEWWLPIFLVQKPSLFFFATAKNRPANRKESLQIYHKVLGKKIGGSHNCVFLVPVHLKSFTISVLQFQQKNIVHLLDTFTFTQRRQFLKFVWCTIFRQNFKESKISTPISRKKNATLSFGFVCFLKDIKVFMFLKVILILLELMQSPVQIHSWSD